MQSQAPGVVASPFERSGYRLLITGGIIVAIGLVLTSAVFLKFGVGLPNFGVSLDQWYLVTGVGYIVQAAGFFIAFLGIARVLHPRH